MRDYDTIETATMIASNTAAAITRDHPNNPPDRPGRLAAATQAGEMLRPRRLPSPCAALVTYVSDLRVQAHPQI